MNHSRPASSPEISVVVPALNEADSIRPLIEGLLNQTLPPQEIVITDAGSTDGTADLVEEFMRKGAPVKLIRESFALPGRARNIAVKNAKSEWIAFTDAGIRPERNWLEALFRKAETDHNVDVVYGTYEPEVRTFFEECAAIAYVSPPNEVDGGMARPYSIVSALMRRRIWESVGGFPEDLRSAEDLLLMRKVERAGFSIARAPNAIVHWNLQPTLWRTFRRFSTYARNNILAGLWREWQLAIFVRYALVLSLIIPAMLVGWRWLLVPVLVWLALMTARAAKAIRQNRFCYPARLGRNVARLLALVPILAVIDLAAFAGSIDWLLRGKLAPGK